MKKRLMPKIEGHKTVSRIVVKDCGEPLVDIKKICPQVTVYLGKDKKGAKAYLRKSVALMVKRAQSYLPKGITFVIRDAWRSSDEQKEILAGFVTRFSAMHPEWSAKRVGQEVAKYAMPTSGPEVSGHMTGGAVDLRLLKNGKRVPMRSWKLTYQENAQPHQPKLPKHLQRNRDMMYAALLKAGLTQCHNEFWHWSYGDVHWARRTGSRVARYGVIGVVGKVERRKVEG